MTLPLWGELQKSLDDSETIEQAIARLVAEHEADPEAHLGEGESLSEHKHEDTIDHPQGSVLADKWTHTEFDVATSFENLSPFIKSGGVSQLWPGFILDPSSSGLANRQYLYVDNESGNLLYQINGTYLFQTVFSMDPSSPNHYMFRAGNSSASNDTTKQGVGFKVDNLSLTFFATNEDGSVVVEGGTTSLTALDLYIVRMYGNVITGNIDCYINGELAVSLSVSTLGTSNYYANIYHIGWTDSGTGPVVWVKSLYFSIAP